MTVSWDVALRNFVEIYRCFIALMMEAVTTCRNIPEGIHLHTRLCVFSFCLFNHFFSATQTVQRRVKE